MGEGVEAERRDEDWRHVEYASLEILPCILDT
jgi:hypothetical protein